MSVPTEMKLNGRYMEKDKLRSIRVEHISKNRLVNGPAKGDDTYLPLTNSWSKNLVRIATIGDGSCFIHAVLKAMYAPYQENNNAQYRVQIAAQIRRDLAMKLNDYNPRYPGHTYWETIGKGSFPRLLMQEIKDEVMIEHTGVDYSLSGLQRLLNSTNYLGDEIYTYISEILNIDIYILRATNTDLYPHINTHQPDVNRNAIIIVGNTEHYEVVALDTPTGFQTIFPVGDPLLDTLSTLFIGDIDLEDQYNRVAYDPDESFINVAAETFGESGVIQLPMDLTEVFQPDDPFIMIFNRLLPRIQSAALIQYQRK
jgi:hypothetical protein